MSGETFTWTFEAQDRVSKPIEDGTDAVAGFEKELKKARGELKRLQSDPAGFVNMQAARKELSKMKRELSGGGEHGGGGLLDQIKSLKHLEEIHLLGEGLKVAWEVGEKVAETIIDIGKDMFRAAGQAERFGISFKALLGEEAGQETLEYIDHIAKATELTDDELKKMSSTLLRAGFTAKQLEEALPAALDLSGFLGGGVENVDAAVGALERLKLTGKASARSLMALGLSEENVLAQLKKDTGISVDVLRKKMGELGEGKLDPDQLLKAVYEQIIEKQHGALGTTAVKMSKTIDAEFKKLKNLPERFFQELANTHGFVKFETFLGKLVDELSPDSPFGKKASAALEGLFDDVFGDLSGEEGIDSIKTGILDALRGVRELVPAFKEFAGDVAASAKWVAGILHDLHEVVDIFDTYNPQRIDKNAAIGKRQLRTNADVQTLNAAKTRAELGLSFTADELNALGRRGVPAESFYRKYAPSPLEMPGSGVLADPAIPSQARNADSGHRSSRQVTVGGVHVQVHVHGSDAQDANAIGDATANKIQQSFERMAVSTGGG